MIANNKLLSCLVLISIAFNAVDTYYDAYGYYNSYSYYGSSYTYDSYTGNHYDAYGNYYDMYGNYHYSSDTYSYYGSSYTYDPSTGNHYDMYGNYYDKYGNYYTASSYNYYGYDMYGNSYGGYGYDGYGNSYGYDMYGNSYGGYGYDGYGNSYGYPQNDYMYDYYNDYNYGIFKYQNEDDSVNYMPLYIALAVIVPICMVAFLVVCIVFSYKRYALRQRAKMQGMTPVDVITSGHDISKLRAGNQSMVKMENPMQGMRVNMRYGQPVVGQRIQVGGYEPTSQPF